MPGRNLGREPTVRSLTCTPLQVAIILSVKRNLSFLIIFLLLLVACSPDQSEPETAGPTPTVLEQAQIDVLVTATLPPTIPPSPTVAPSATLPPSTPDDDPTVPSASATPNSPPATRHSPQVISGQTTEGAFFLGNPDAPVTVIDYSDFL